MQDALNTPHARGPTRGADSQHDGGAARSPAVDTPVPPTGTVLGMPRGEYWHVPVAGSIPQCGAVTTDYDSVERMTRYRAEEEKDLEPCSACHRQR